MVTQSCIAETVKRLFRVRLLHNYFVHLMCNEMRNERLSKDNFQQCNQNIYVQVNQVGKNT